MKVFVVFALVACVSAEPGLLLNHGFLNHGLLAPVVHSAPAVVHAAPALVSHPVAYAAPAIIAPTVTKSQYHAQDELGQASYGHAEPGQAHAAVRDAFGNVAGSYAYINPEGKEIRVNYIADALGFRVASNALPIAPAVPEAPALIAPLPVADTPEVAEAKIAHAKAIAEAKARNVEAEKADAGKDAEGKSLSRRKRGLIAAAPIAYHAPAVIAAPAVVAVPAVREATLTKIVNNPLHAVSYRVD